jgi:hypothetical protein
VADSRPFQPFCSIFELPIRLATLPVTTSLDWFFLFLPACFSPTIGIGSPCATKTLVIRRRPPNHSPVLGLHFSSKVSLYLVISNCNEDLQILIVGGVLMNLAAFEGYQANLTLSLRFACLPMNGLDQIGKRWKNYLTCRLDMRPKSCHVRKYS